MNILRGEVEVEIGGKTRLVKFGLNSLALYTERQGVDLSDVQGFGLSQMRDMIWAGLVAGAKKRGEPADFDEWTVGDWIEEMDQAEYERIVSALNNSMPEESKKKDSE